MKRSFLLLLLAMARLSAETVPLAAVVNIRDADYEHARPVPDQSAKNSPLVIAGRAYPKGLGTQADNRTAVELNGATRFTAFAGVDDATESALPVHLEVQVDGQTAWQQEMKKGEAAAAIDLDVRGKKTLVLICRDLGNNYTQALADWADAQFTVEGDKPKSVFPPAIAEEYVILTPKAPAAPRLNGARVFGVRPGHPFFYQIPATGERPMKFSAEDLPAGLTLDAATGRITGAIAAPGTHRVTLRATNAHGTDTQPWRIEVGEKIALTPAMGWNSWNCWGVSVDQEKVLASARAIVAQGLVEHGWSYINIDDTWQGARPGPAHALQANGKFPDLKKFCDELHAMGLKAGIYSTPWITSYAGYPGGSADNPAVTGSSRRRRSSPTARSSPGISATTRSPRSMRSNGRSGASITSNTTGIPTRRPRPRKWRTPCALRAATSSTACRTTRPSPTPPHWPRSPTPGARPGTSATPGATSATSGPSRKNGASSPAPATGTTPTCSSSARLMSAAAGASVPRA